MCIVGEVVLVRYKSLLPRYRQNSKQLLGLLNLVILQKMQLKFYPTGICKFNQNHVIYSFFLNDSPNNYNIFYIYIQLQI